MRNGRSESRKGGWWAAAFAFAALFVAYLPGLIGRRTLFLRDIGSHQLPWRLLWAQQLRAGHLPLWDPFSLGGTPLLANPNTLALYPPVALFLVFPPHIALTLYILGHQLLLGLGAALMLKRLALPRPAILAGALACAGSGIAFSQAAFMTGPAALTWVPFLLASAVAWPSDARAQRRRIAEAALSGCLLLLGGKPFVAVLGWTAWGIVILLQRRGRELRRRMPAVVAPVLAAALAAPLLLSATQLVPTSWRATAGTPAAAVSADAFAPRRWPEIVLPRLYGLPTASTEGGFWAAHSFPWQRYELDLHLGTLTLLLLLLSAGRKEARPWLVGAGALVVLAACPSILVRAGSLLPPLRLFRYAIKFLLPAVVVMAPAVAVGYSVASKRPSAFRRWAGVLAILLVPVGLLATDPSRLQSILASLFPASAATLALPGVADAISRAILLDVLLALLPLLAAALSPRRLLLPALTVQLLLGGWWMLAWDSPSRWETPPALASAVRNHPAVIELYHGDRPWTPGGEGEVAASFRRLRAGLARHYGVRWGISYRGISGPDGTEPAWMRLMAARFRQAPPLEAARAARHIGVAWLLTDRPLSEGIGWTARLRPPGAEPGSLAYRLDAALPAAWLAREVLTVPSEEALWRTLTDPATVPGFQAVVLGPHATVAARPEGRCRVLGRDPGNWSVEVASREDALLVVNQADSPLWRAETAAGARLQTVRVNGFLVGIEVPPGRHVVRLRVDASRARLGFLIFALALLVTARLAVGAPSRRRPTPTDGAAPTPPASPPEPSP